MDLVTQLQAEINNLGMLFYDSVGSLQAQAAPVSIAGEDVMRSTGAAAGPGSAATAAAAGQAAPAGTSAGGAAPGGGAADPAAFNVQDASQAFASRLMDGFRRVEQLAAKLPQVPRGDDGEREQLARIRGLQVQDAALSQELQQLMVVSEARLEHVQQVYAVLAHDQLMQRHE